MELITRDRDRLLQRAARVYGLSFTVVSALCLLVPGVVSPTTLLWAGPLYLLLAFAQWRMGATDAIGWVLLSLVAGAAILVVVVTLDSETGAAALPALLHISAASLASVGLVLTRSPHRIALLVVAFVLITATTMLLTATYQEPLRTAIMLLLGWILAAIIGVWIGASIPQVAKRIASIGRAHRAERQASELEAQRRQSARLLHDTVLATLTLLAHSGVGVSTDALRAQAGDDARLLRQLRLGTIGGTAEESSSPVATDETVLGTTLESVKQRFGRIGLEVSWHGTGQVLLPSDVLDAFLLALSESLENVRRHAGVEHADVTITQTDDSLRAVITDAGVGFSPEEIAASSLGFTESIVARLRDVGGSARVFSTPGAGTTVILEVPR